MTADEYRLYRNNITGPVVSRTVTTDAIAERLYLPELPPVDVLVRTSGERRVSNFLLWQSAGAAIHFTEKPWPDFDAAELDAALALVP